MKPHVSKLIKYLKNRIFLKLEYKIKRYNLKNGVFLNYEVRY